MKLVSWTAGDDVDVKLDISEAVVSTAVEVTKDVGLVVTKQTSHKSSNKL